MPNIQSAKKKLRKDIKKEKQNLSYKKTVKKMIKNMSKIKDKQSAADEVRKAYSMIDKAAKKNVIHKNAAARLKSQITRTTLSAAT